MLSQWNAGTGGAELLEISTCRIGSFATSAKSAGRLCSGCCRLAAHGQISRRHSLKPDGLLPAKFCYAVK